MLSIVIDSFKKKVYISPSPKTLCFQICVISVNETLQGSHRLEKYLNLEGFLEKSLKIKSALKVLEKHTKALEGP